MALMTFDGIPNDLGSVLRAYYGAGTQGMTDQQVLAYHIRETARPLYRAYKRRLQVATALAGEEAARVAKEAALEVERSARVTAEAAADAAADTALNGVS